MGEQVEVLEHHAHLLPVQVDVRTCGSVISVPSKIDSAGGGRLQQVQAPQEGGFTAAGGPDDNDDLALVRSRY